MSTTILQAGIPDYRDYAFWLLSFVVVIVGLMHAKGIVAFVLQKLYQLFIKDNPSGI